MPTVLDSEMTVTQICFENLKFKPLLDCCFAKAVILTDSLIAALLAAIPWQGALAKDNNFNVTASSDA